MQIVDVAEVGVASARRGIGLTSRGLDGLWCPKDLQSKIPRGAQINEIECTVPAKNGVLGIGKKPGTYRVRWSAPFVAEASYTMPAVVNAVYWG